MQPRVCSIVSPHLLDALAASEDPQTRQSALDTIAHSHHVRGRRKDHFHAKSQNSGRIFQKRSNRHDHQSLNNSQPILQGIVPDQVLENVAGSVATDLADGNLAQHKTDIKEQLGKTAQASMENIPSGLTSTFNRQVYDMRNAVKQSGKVDETFQLLPGTLVRSEGSEPVSDLAANQAYDNCATVLSFYLEVFGYAFLDDHSTPIISSIHFESGYQNAQWVSGPVKQMIYGDGGRDLCNFTACLDVIGHEMTHAVTEHVCNMKYEGESGALNEHISDAFGMMVTLWAEKKTCAEADWLIGEGCLRPSVKGVALRHMKYPGTAYDDEKFKKDLQPASMTEVTAYKAKHKYWESYDHGSVHAFSGVPNRAFVLASEALGGYCWETTGRIWWKTLRSDRVPPSCSFVQFADITVAVAAELFNEGTAKIVRRAWEEVGVVGTDVMGTSK